MRHAREIFLIVYRVKTHFSRITSDTPNDGGEAPFVTAFSLLARRFVILQCGQATLRKPMVGVDLPRRKQSREQKFDSGPRFPASISSISIS